MVGMKKTVIHTLTLADGREVARITAPNWVPMWKSHLMRVVPHGTDLLGATFATKIEESN